jgi:hypothetical protein
VVTLILAKVEFQVVGIHSRVGTQAKVVTQVDSVAAKLCQVEMPWVSDSSEWSTNLDGSCLIAEITTKP